MKLIKKLAVETYYEWAKPFPRDAEITMNPEHFFSEAYEAGFRKAREMAALLAAREEGSTAYWITRIGEEEAE